MAKMCREFSSKNVFSQNINFTKMQQEVRYYNGKTVQPLYVVMLRTFEDVEKFAEATRLYDMGLHTWLVIFMRSKSQKFNKICRRPNQNHFNLVVSSRMLVKCFNDPLLREWYSVNKRTIDTFDYGAWLTKDNRLVKFTKQNFYERRSNFKGTRLKVSAVKVRFIFFFESFFLNRIYVNFILFSYIGFHANSKLEKHDGWILWCSPRRTITSH